MSKKKIKVLIVEDEIALRQAMVDKFTREGFWTFAAKDGEDGLNQALTERPDIILLDIIMPNMDGLTMLKILRNDQEWGKDVPVMVLTNLSDVDNVSRAVENGVYEFLVKSDWRLDDLVDKVKEKLHFK